MRIAIRWKVMMVMLAIAVTPLLITAGYDLRALSQLGNQLAAQSADALSEQARVNLEQIADGYGRVVERERQVVELIVRLQAQAIEAALAGPVFEAAPSIYWAADFDNGDPGLNLQSFPLKYVRSGANGSRVPIPVSLEFLAFHTAGGVQDRHRSETAYLQRLLPFMQKTYQQHGDLIYWQYAALESGILATYPGHGGYPDAFDPRTRLWYQQQKTDPRFRWSQLHVDVSSGIPLINATLPLFSPAGEFLGVTGVDVRIANLLQSLTLPTGLGDQGRVLLAALSDTDEVSGGEILVVARQHDDDLRDDWKLLPAVERFATDSEVHNELLYRDIEHGRGGYLRTTYHGEDTYCVYRPFGPNRSSLIFLLPAAAVVEPAMQAARYAMASTKRQIDALIPIGLGAVALVIVVAFFMSRAIITPVDELSRAVQSISKGDFEVRVAINTGDELQALGEAFNDMVPQLEENTRVREALSLANEVQQRLLPSQSPDIEGIEVSGFSRYCDQTGGDYYDFIDLSGDDHSLLAVVLGDVSGHGVASALLMTTVRALLHGVATDTTRPCEVLQHINVNLVGDVHAGHFMTLFYLQIDARERSIKWASAGHDPAICYDPGSKTFSELAGSDIPLGIDGDWCYENVDERRLIPGEIIVLGTDGIWETRNAEGEQFGKDRLRHLIEQVPGRSPEQICDHILAALNAFRGEAPQRDDITAVVVRSAA